MWWYRLVNRHLGIRGTTAVDNSDSPSIVEQS